ncbi:MAG: cupin domain-containing protein [Undibacterium curvum]|jgi:quercetin dioxygenase-like cupin family protein|uniref:Cupin domain-containing protein n=1 Tax=Undibacterium curvum TaxID=2762294 RepID=A0ABR7A4D6_9BURK|nr:cupin domain-containing protein [Undibacterium curvum]MBC3931781.1 cupin domain-containing protein [Undibacterium curvum]
MPLTHVKSRAAALPDAWQSTVLGKAAGASLKVLRMDATGYPEQMHDFDQGLFVLDGQLNLELDGKVISVRAGELFIVPASKTHAVARGSFGTLMMIDNAA